MNNTFNSIGFHSIGFHSIGFHSIGNYMIYEFILDCLDLNLASFGKSFYDGNGVYDSITTMDWDWWKLINEGRNYDGDWWKLINEGENVS